MLAVVEDAKLLIVKDNDLLPCFPTFLSEAQIFAIEKKLKESEVSVRVQQNILKCLEMERAKQPYNLLPKTPTYNWLKDNNMLQESRNTLYFNLIEAIALAKK